MDEFTLRLEDIELRRDLVANGWSDRDIYRHVRSGTLTKLRYGAYIRSELLRGFETVDLSRARSRAVLRTAHPTSVLSHHSALAEWEVPLWGVDIDLTHLTRTDGMPGRREAGVVHHTGVLARDEWTFRHGVPVVQPARAVLEVISTASPEVGLVVACGALSTGRTTQAQLRAADSRTERWPNSISSRLVLARADARLTSVAEARTWHLFHEFRIPRPEPQVHVYDERGQLLGIVDFAWREARVFLEVDGRVKYERFRRPGETLEEYLMREKRRQELICQVTGWTCARIVWADLEQGPRTAFRIRNLLDGRTEPAA